MLFDPMRDWLIAKGRPIINGRPLVKVTDFEDLGYELPLFCPNCGTALNNIQLIYKRLTHCRDCDTWWHLVV